MMKCGHTATQGSGDSKHIRCTCCGRVEAVGAQWNSIVSPRGLPTFSGEVCTDCWDGTTPPPPAKRMDVTVQTEPATAGPCMFCGEQATRRFVGDDTVRICERCVKSA